VTASYTIYFPNRKIKAFSSKDSKDRGKRGEEGGGGERRDGGGGGGSFSGGRGVGRGGGGGVVSLPRVPH